MNAPQQLNALGQSLWLDNITRSLLDSGTLQRYIDDLAVTGLTSNPTIFDHALKGSADYDADIRRKLKQGQSGEALFFELALDDITRAADLFAGVHQRSPGREKRQRYDVGLADVLQVHQMVLPPADSRMLPGPCS